MLQARSGSLSAHGHLDRPPLTVGGGLGEYVTGAFAALGAVTAWRRAARTHVPETVDVSMLESLWAAEDVTLTFTPDAVARIADYAARVNDHAENIGARRLHTVMERLLDELSFDAPEHRDSSVVIDEGYVERMLADIVTNEDLSRYIL